MTNWAAYWTVFSWSCLQRSPRIDQNPSKHIGKSFLEGVHSQQEPLILCDIIVLEADWSKIWKISQDWAALESAKFFSLLCLDPTKEFQCTKIVDCIKHFSYQKSIYEPEKVKKILPKDRFVNSDKVELLRHSELHCFYTIIEPFCFLLLSVRYEKKINKTFILLPEFPLKLRNWSLAVFG